MRTTLLAALCLVACGTDPDPGAGLTTLPDGAVCPSGTRVCPNSSSGNRCVPYSHPANCGTCNHSCPVNMECSTSAPFVCR